MKFVLPGPEYEEQAKEYIREFQKCQSDINGCAGLDKYLQESLEAEFYSNAFEEGIQRYFITL